MSLIVTIRLLDDELLFVADRCVCSLDATNEVLNHTATTLKLRELNGGVVGFVGDAGLATTFVEEIGALTGGASHENHIQQRLGLFLAQHLRLLTEAAAANSDLADARQKVWSSCSYLFGVYDHDQKRSKLVGFSPDTFFTPRYETESVTVLGMTGHAERLLHFFRRESYTLEQGQRLATLLALATHNVAPNMVSRDVDMWKLGGDGIKKYAAEEIRSLQEHAQRFLNRMKTDLYS